MSLITYKKFIIQLLPCVMRGFRSIGDQCENRLIIANVQKIKCRFAAAVLWNHGLFGPLCEEKILG